MPSEPRSFGGPPGKGVEGGLEKFRIYDNFVQSIEQSRAEVVEAI